MGKEKHQNTSILYEGVPATDLIALPVHLRGLRVARLRERDGIDLHWLPVKERILFCNLTYFHKCLNDNTPKYFLKLLHSHEPGRILKSEGTNLKIFA